MTTSFADFYSTLKAEYRGARQNAFVKGKENLLRKVVVGRGGK